MRPIAIACRTASARNCPGSRLLTRQTEFLRPCGRTRALTTRNVSKRIQPKPSINPPCRLIGTKQDARHHSPTIYALSTAPGRAAIAAIRISGPACLDVYQRLCPGKRIPDGRRAAVRTLYEPGSDESRDAVLDSTALVLYFPAPRTVTGEDVLELHVHGGPAIVKAVLSAIAKCGDGDLNRIRYAEPGEFTRRAFMNDRIDLTQVEALGDTLSADTEQQRRLSVRGTRGGLAKQYEAWRQQLLYARGELEALIDFSEDQHFDESPAELCASVAEQVKALKRSLQVHSKNAVRGELLRHGISISLLGAPNAGKSSLLNRIIGREAAIVSQEAGTTRDIVEVGVDLGGYFCRFGDTAGLRQGSSHTASQAHKSGQTPPPLEVINQIEIEGMRRAKQRAADSDLVVVVLSFEKTDDSGQARLQLDAEVCAVAKQLMHGRGGDNVILVINKSDLARGGDGVDRALQEVQEKLPKLGRDCVHLVSCLADEASAAAKDEDPGGIQGFLQGLIGQFGKLTAALTPDGADGAAAVDAATTATEPDPSIWEESLGASERHRVLLDACIAHLDDFLAETDPETNHPTDEEAAEADIVVAAEHLRSAAHCLAKITGRGEAGDVEEVLGVVFEKFCVGK